MEIAVFVFIFVGRWTTWTTGGKSFKFSEKFSHVPKIAVHSRKNVVFRPSTILISLWEIESGFWNQVIEENFSYILEITV